MRFRCVTRASRAIVATTKTPAAPARLRPVNSASTQGGWTMAVRHKVGTIAGTMVVALSFFQGTASAQTLSFNQKTATYVKTFVGNVPYTYGGTSPSSGFD